MGNFNRGAATGDLLWVLAIIAGLWILWAATGGPARPEATAGPFLQPPAPLGTGEIYSLDSARRLPRAPSARLQRADGAVADSIAPNQTDLSVVQGNHSPWFGQIKIRTGNARYEIQTNREYIELIANNQLNQPVALTGWSLANGKNQRSYQLGVTEVPGVSDVVLIPAVIKLFVTGAADSAKMPIILESGGRVVVNTGSPPSTNLWPAPGSFQINKCIGFLAEDVSQFRMSPTLPRACPTPRSEPGLERLDNNCYDFVRRLSTCHTPEFERRADGYNYIDGRVGTLASQCRAYVQAHFNYNSCVIWHRDDPDFYTSEWRVFLNRPWELWNENRETISLYDAQGRLVDEVSY